MTYEEAMRFIHNEKWQDHKPGLSRTRALLAALGNPERELKFIHIAGTNGKGSTAAMLASILKEAGYRTGLFTSPHVYSFEERIQIDGENIEKEELAGIVGEIAEFADAMEDIPTEFEIITAVGLLYFYRKGCDIVVLETGMGGELDSTNVIPVPEVAVITNIGLEHTAYLGDTITKIAEAKAGIIKEGGNVVIYGEDPEAEAVFERVCEEKHAKLTRPDFESLNPVMHDWEGQIFDYRCFDNLKMPLLGEYQLKNAAVALSVIRVMNRMNAGWFIRDENIRQGLLKVRWRGRLEVISRAPLVLVDASHNPQGLAATAACLTEYLEGSRLTFLVTSSSDKDVREGFKALVPIAHSFVAVTHSNTARAMDAEQLADVLRGMGDMPVTAAKSIEEGCRLALADSRRSAGLCAIGSLFQVADVTETLKKLL